MHLKSWSVLGLLCVCFLSARLFAQSSGSFTGTVVDSTGAAVAGAQVSVSDPTTGFRRSTVTNSDGNTLLCLGASTYDIIITAPGFEKYEARKVILRVGEKLRVDTKLVIGKVTSEIVVEATPPAKLRPSPLKWPVRLPERRLANWN